MSEAFMAYPELRHPFEATQIHQEGSTTVLYQGKVVNLVETGSGDGLLINPEDLTRVNGFELKPEGACYKDMCIPMNDDLLIKQNGRQWFNLSAFANLLGQSYVVDHEAGEPAGDLWGFMLLQIRNTIGLGMADWSVDILRATQLLRRPVLQS